MSSRCSLQSATDLTLSCSCSGQSGDDFYRPIIECTGPRYLMISYIALEALTTDVLDFDVHQVTERLASADPLEGVRQQARYIKMLFGYKKVPRTLWARKNPAVHFALRPPSEIWPALKRGCVWCGEEAKSSCTGCFKVRYCNPQCQRK